VTNNSNVVAYDLSGWIGFLLPTIVPAIHRIIARPGESCDEVFHAVPPNTRAFVFHIDLTDSAQCPHERTRLIEKLQRSGIRVLNGSVTDISKTFVQSICAANGLNVTRAPRHGLATERVVVKTDRNHGGKPEGALDVVQRAALNIDSRQVWHRPDHGYVVSTRQSIPTQVWDDSAFVVERYIENPDDLFYRVYLIDHYVAISEGCEHALMKTIGRAERRRLLLLQKDNMELTEATVPLDLHPLVQEVLGFVRATNLDFGCLDVARDGAGRFYVIDMNSTPHWGREREYRIIEHLAHGAGGVAEYSRFTSE
jgi:hypothetical protein